MKAGNRGGNSKPGGHRDLSLAKSYRPISLLNIGSKLVDAIITQRIHYHSAHTPHFLSVAPYSGCIPGVSATDAVGTILEKGRNAIRRGKSTAFSCIDVGGAFNNIDHRRIVEEVEARTTRGLARWLRQWLQNRSFTGAIRGVYIGGLFEWKGEAYRRVLLRNHVYVGVLRCSHLKVRKIGGRCGSALSRS